MKDFTKFKDLKKDQQIKLIALLIAALVLVVILVGNFKTVRRQKIVPAARARIEAKEQIRRSRQKIYKKKEMPAEIQELLKLAGRDDPFSPPSLETEEVTYPSLSLAAIVWDEKNPMAIINDTIVNIGDTIEGRKVLRIEKNQVVLEEDTGEIILRLGGSEEE